VLSGANNSPLRGENSVFGGRTCSAGRKQPFDRLRASEQRAAPNSQKIQYWSKGAEFEADSRHQLREPGVSYIVGFGPKNCDIGTVNEYFLNNNNEISIS
jgi:hypothetical protein